MCESGAPCPLHAPAAFCGPPSVPATDTLRTVGLRARVYYRRNTAWLREAFGLPPLGEAPRVLAEAVVPGAAAR